MVEVNVLKTQMCPHCPRAAAVAKKVAAELGGVQVKETYLDTDPAGQEIATKHEIMSVPTILINDRVAFVGVPNESALRKAIEEAQ